jgi:Tol biopolymer transport system component
MNEKSVMKNKNLVLGILILIILGVVFVSGCVQQDGDGTDGQNGDGAIMPADLTQLTFFEEAEGRAVDPDFSPDGSQIVFCLMKGSPDNSELYLTNADGTGLAKIDLGFDPSWSPVENKIAYTSNNQIYTMNSDGKEITQLTTENSNGNPAWSPNGTKIIYTYYEAEKTSIWIMNSDGTGKTPLTTLTDGECSLPSFSYDGSKIIYVKGPRWNTFVEILPTKLNEIWIMNSDGSNKHMIYAPEDSYQWPFQRAWNKNSEILFLKSGILEDKLPKLFIINSDGTNPRHMFSLPYDSLGMPELFYLDPVWDNTYTKVVAVKKVIDGAQNIVTFSWEE